VDVDALLDHSCDESDISQDLVNCESRDSNSFISRKETFQSTELFSFVCSPTTASRAQTNAYSSDDSDSSNDSDGEDWEDESHRSIEVVPGWNSLFESVGSEEIGNWGAAVVISFDDRDDRDDSDDSDSMYASSVIIAPRARSVKRRAKKIQNNKSMNTAIKEKTNESVH